ncbi:hypothetical protein GPALN_010140 [Globodera pallida]|nr:hypothetical protein GPALN_010140 [Globodera pallida]
MRFLNLWVKIFTTFFLPNLSNGQLSTNPSTKPFYLTDGQNGVKSIPYRATAQCMPKTEENGKTYGLSFRLYSEGGHCDDGLLICYPGMLMRHYSSGIVSSAFKVKGTFQVGNEKNGSVSQKCNAFLEKNGITNGKHWRGMNVYTKSLNDRKTNPSRQTILETSLTPNVYELGNNVSQFSIHLGVNGTDLLTMITLNEGKYLFSNFDQNVFLFSGKKPFIDNESNLQNQFSEQFWKGAFLREHTGLWMLGLDLLPSMEQQNVKLFIARNCSCTMEAWLTQPTDSIDPTEPELPTAGSNNCPTKETNQTFSIDLIGLELPAKIVIKAITDDNLNSIIVELLQGDAMGKNSDAVIVFTIKTDELKVFLPETALNVIKSSQLLVGNHKMLLKIYLLKYCYAISLNGNRLGGLFWPKHWWNRKEVNSIKLNGQMLLLEDPRVDKLAGNEFKNIRLVELPNFWPIASFRENSTFLFRVQLLNLSRGFKIIFSNNSTFDEKTDNTAFVVQVVDLKRVELGIYYGGRAHPEQENRKDSSFKAGNAYEFFISVFKSFYGIRLNGENLFENYANSMPFCDIKFVRVEGDAVLLDEPELNAPPEKEFEKVYAHALNNTLLNYGDKIILNGTLNPTSKIIKIKLQNKDERCSKICGEMTLEILLAKDGFYGEQPGNLWNKLCPYYKPKNISIAATFIPPWAIDHITVNGSTFDTLQIRVEIASSLRKDLFYETGTEVFKPILWKRINFTQVIKKEGVDSVNYSVFVNMTLEGGLKPDSEVRVNFFNEALEFHDLFGSTVLWMMLRNNTLFFNSFVNQNKTWSEPEQNNNLEKLLPPNLYFKIDVHETDGKAEFYVTLNGQDKDVNQKVLKYKCPDNVYVPDIQYITVEYKNVTLAAGSEVEVSCSSEVDCANKR